MSAKEQMAQMQIQAELEKALAALISYSQYIDSRTDYGRKLKEIQEKLNADAKLLAAIA